MEHTLLKLQITTNNVTSSSIEKDALIRYMRYLVKIN